MTRIAALVTALPLAALTVLAAPPARADVTCEAKGQTAFFATFGDVTQKYDGAGSVDDVNASLYNMPAAYLTNAAMWWGNGVVGTDVMMADDGGRQEPVWREFGFSSRHVLTRLVRRHNLRVRGRTGDDDDEQ